MNRNLVVWLALVAGLMSAAAQAASPPVITGRSESQAGRVRMAKLTGYIKLGANEQLVDARMVYNNARGYAGEAVGTWDPAKGTWVASMGAFDMVSYYVRVKVKYGPNAVYYYYSTPTCTWGR